MILTIKRTGCPIERIQDPTPELIRSYAHAMVEAAYQNKLEVFQIINNVKDPIREIRT